MKKRAAAFATGAAGYSCIEIAARGYTHWTMAILGGICLMALCAIARRAGRLPLVLQAALGAGFITAAEFITGAVVNLALGWRVWDYSAEPGNLLGQICPLFSLYWFLLCVPVMACLRLARTRRAPRREKERHPAP